MKIFKNRQTYIYIYINVARESYSVCECNLTSSALTKRLWLVTSRKKLFLEMQRSSRHSGSATTSPEEARGDDDALRGNVQTARANIALVEANRWLNRAWKIHTCPASGIGERAFLWPLFSEYSTPRSKREYVNKRKHFFSYLSCISCLRNINRTCSRMFWHNLIDNQRISMNCMNLIFDYIFVMKFVQRN